MKAPIYFRAATPDDIAEFCKRTSYWPGEQFNGIVAYTDSAVMGMVGFDSWAPRTVMAHWWIRHPRCIAPLWAEAVKYIAGTGRKSILGATPGNLDKALKSIYHLGWVQLYRIKDGWDEGVDLVISEYRIYGNAKDDAAAVRGRAA